MSKILIFLLMVHVASVLGLPVRSLIKEYHKIPMTKPTSFLNFFGKAFLLKSICRLCIYIEKTFSDSKTALFILLYIDLFLEES